jgi:hypothetical protein
MLLDLAKKQKDLLFGEQEEENLNDTLNDFFSCELENTKKKYGKYCPFDYEDIKKNIRVELKSRRIKHNNYKSGIMIAYNKIKHAYAYENDGNNNEWYFVWNCIDGIYWTQFKKEFLNLPRFDRELKRGEIARNQCDIPLSYLTKIEFEDEEE